MKNIKIGPSEVDPLAAIEEFVEGAPIDQTSTACLPGPSNEPFRIREKVVLGGFVLMLNVASLSPAQIEDSVGRVVSVSGDYGYESIRQIDQVLDAEASYRPETIPAEYLMPDESDLEESEQEKRIISVYMDVVGPFVTSRSKKVIL